jgi:hypothetical protein
MIALAAVAITFFGTLSSGLALSAQLERESGGPWLEQAKQALAQNPGVNVQDTFVPGTLINPYLWPEEARASKILAEWATGQEFNQPSRETPWMFNSTGDLRQGRFVAQTSVGPFCAEIGPTTRPISMGAFPFEGPYILRADLSLRESGWVLFTNGSSQWRMWGEAGQGTWYLPGANPQDPLRVQGDASGCVTQVTSGRLSAP